MNTTQYREIWGGGVFSALNFMSGWKLVAVAIIFTLIPKQFVSNNHNSHLWRHAQTKVNALWTRPVNTLSSTHRQRPCQHALVNAPPTPCQHITLTSLWPPTHKDCKKIKVQLELYIQQFVTSSGRNHIFVISFILWNTAEITKL
jgi:hypothetical protein